MDDPTPKNLGYSPEFLAALRENMKMSPHTVRLINNPIHAYLCTGDDCREATNAEGAE